MADLEHRRLGRFCIPDAVRNLPPQFATIFASMVPLDINHDWQSQRLEYVCWAPFFTVVPVGAKVPLYKGTFDGERWIWSEVPPT